MLNSAACAPACRCRFGSIRTHDSGMSEIKSSLIIGGAECQENGFLDGNCIRKLCSFGPTTTWALLTGRSREEGFFYMIYIARQRKKEEKSCNFMHFMFQLRDSFRFFILLLVNSTSPNARRSLRKCV